MATKNATDCVQAGNIPEGTCFVKRYGTQVYLRVSSSALRFFDMGEERIIGVASNGNMCEVGHSKLVRPVAHTEMLQINPDKDFRAAQKWIVEAFVQEQKLTTHESRRYIEIPMEDFKAGDRFRLTIEKIIPRDKERDGA